MNNINSLLKGLIIIIGIYLLFCYISGEQILSFNTILNIAKMCGKELYRFAIYVVNVLFEIVLGGIDYVY